MSWEKYAYTSAGAAMLSESISGGALTITRAVSGTGTVDTDLSEETAVSGDTYELKLLGIDTVEYEGEKARKVSIWTGGADKPYFMHQIGVFGRLNDDPEDTLLFLMQDDRGIEIPAIGTADHEFQIAVLLAVSTKANISLTVDPQVEAIMRMVREMVLKEISQHNDAPDAHAKIITEATSKALKELEESGQIMSEDRVKELIKESGEFVVNLPTESLVKAIDWCGVKSGRDVDKFAAMHLTAAPAAKLGTVLLEESPVNLECKVTQVIPLGSHDLFLAECVAVDVDEKLLDENGKLCLNKAKLIVYSHGDYLALGRKLGSFGYSVRKKKKPIKK